MEVNKMRELVKSAYSGLRWNTRVDKMSDKQVIAIYYNLVNQGRIKNDRM